MSQPPDPADDSPPATPSAPAVLHPTPPAEPSSDSPSETPPKRPLHQRLFSDKFALAFSTFFAHGLRIGTTMIMGRILSNEDYGLFALVTLAPAVIVSWGDIYISSLLVQIRDRDEREVYDTSQLLVFLLGILYFASYCIAGYYLYAHVEKTLHDWRVLALAPLIGAVSFLSMVYALQLALLNRRGARGKESKQNFIYSLTQASTGIFFALLFVHLGKPHYAVFALVLQSVIGQLVANAAIWRSAPPTWPRFATLSTAKRILHLSAFASTASYASVLENRFFEYLIFSKAPGDLGKAALGNWTRAITVQQLFSQNLGVSIERVVYSKLCAVKEDAAQFLEISRRSLETLLLFNFFCAAWLFSLAPDIVRVILGPNWTAVPPLLSIVALAIPAGGIFSVANMLCFAQGKTTPLLKWSFVRLLIVAIAFLFFPAYPAINVAIIWAVSRYLHAIATLLAAWKVAGVRPPAATFGHIAGIFAAAVLSSLSMLLLLRLTHAVPALPRLLLCSFTGLGIFLLFSSLYARDAVEYPLRMAKGR